MLCIQLEGHRLEMLITVTMNVLASPPLPRVTGTWHQAAIILIQAMIMTIVLISLLPYVSNFIF